MNVINIREEIKERINRGPEQIKDQINKAIDLAKTSINGSELTTQEIQDVATANMIVKSIVGGNTKLLE